jgi:hypothetical protein
MVLQNGHVAQKLYIILRSDDSVSMSFHGNAATRNSIHIPWSVPRAGICRNSSGNLTSQRIFFAIELSNPTNASRLVSRLSSLASRRSRRSRRRSGAFSSRSESVIGRLGVPATFR